MANYILGDVMTAEAFITKDGALKHYFSANTLTESTMNISVTAEEIRGGSGNRLLGKIFHDTNFGVNLTDAMWSLEYMAAQIGEEISKGEANLLKSYTTTIDKIDADTGIVTFAEDEALQNLGTMFAGASTFCSDANKQIFWVKDCNGKVYTVEVEGGVYTIKDANGLKDTDQVCVTYPEKHSDVEQLIVNAAYAPKEFSLFLTGKLFQGDSCKKSDGKYVAKLVIEIPRFQLDGTVDLTLNPSSAATVALNGIALAYGCNCGEDAQGEYAKMSIIPVGNAAADTDKYKGYTKIVVQDAESLKAGDPIIVYMTGDKKMPVPYKGKISAVDNASASVLNDNGFLIKDDASAGEITVTAEDISTKPTCKAKITA